LLQKQIEMGAPVDVFASAGEKQMNELQSRGFIFPETRHDFARNALVLIIPANSRHPLRSFTDLIRPEIAKIAIGNPKTVPAGQYAQEVLVNTKLWNKLQPRIVLAENARQIVDYVARAEVDAGIVYASDRINAPKTISIAAHAPQDSYTPILYPIAVVTQTGDRGNARRFINLTLGSAGQRVLEKYGFLRSR
jgi:molybdate transport system substrate-binding protein